MEMATHHPAKPAGPEPAPAAAPAPIDPEHEIDAKKTAILLTVCLVFVIGCLWALGVVFDYTVRGEQKAKIDDLAPLELQALRATEDAMLKKAPPPASDPRGVAELEASIRRTTDEIIRAYVKKD